jgi:hypothetical protein
MDDDYRKIVEDFAKVAKELNDQSSIDALLRIGKYVETMKEAVEHLQTIVKKRGPHTEAPRVTSHK